MGYLFLRVELLLILGVELMEGENWLLNINKWMSNFNVLLKNLARREWFGFTGF